MPRQVQPAADLQPVAQDLRRLDRIGRLGRLIPRRVEAAERGEVELAIPYQLHGLEGDSGRMTGVTLATLKGEVKTVQADHLLVLYTCWELTSITSFLLIGNRHTESRARAAARCACASSG